MIDSCFIFVGALRRRTIKLILLEVEEKTSLIVVWDYSPTYTLINAGLRLEGKPRLDHPYSSLIKYGTKIYDEENMDKRIIMRTDGVFFENIPSYMKNKKLQLVLESFNSDEGYDRMEFVLFTL